ncbi:hypothetical protein F5Y11DRAFT_340904, partial [Daldinia sp. FL1419]
LWVEPDESGSRAKTAPKPSLDPATGRSPIRRETSHRRAGNSRNIERRRQLRDIRDQRTQRINEILSRPENIEILSQPDDADNARILHRADRVDNAEDELGPSGLLSIPESVSSFFRILTIPPGQHASDDEIDAEIAAELAAFLRGPRRVIDSTRSAQGEEDAWDDEPPALEEGVRSSTQPTRRQHIRAARANRSNGSSPTDSDDWDASILPSLDDYYRTRSRRVSPMPRIHRFMDRFGHLREEDREVELARDRTLAMVETPGSSMDHHIHTALREMSDRRRRSGVDRRRVPRVRYVDGLGDRDRSLSPEGDGVWSILQSTLTIDPQPPSAGSSFASTTASTIASLNPTVSSSRTSITSPNDEVEPPCDPVPEPESTTDASGTDDQGADRPRRPTPHGRRSYAAVAADTQPSTGISPDDPEWLSGMHRIVSGLASREDIPEEWWQQAGLSRSMSWGWPS